MTKLHTDLLNKCLLMRVLVQLCQACVTVTMQASPCQCLKQCSTQACYVCSAHLRLQVLRDAGRRSSYDALRGGYGGFEGSSSSSGVHEAHWRPGADNFDDFFNNWWQRQG